MMYQIKTELYLDGELVGTSISVDEYSFEEANIIASERTFIKENVMAKSEVVISQHLVVNGKGEIAC